MRAVILSPSADTVKLGERVAPSAEWRAGDPDDQLAETAGEFDLVVSAPPLGMRRASRHGAGATEVAFDLLLGAAQRLTPNGAMVFLLSDAFFFRRDATRVRELLAAEGLHAEAAISVEGALRPHSDIAANLVFVTRRAADDRLFIGRLNTGTDQHALIENLVARRGGKVLQLGYLYPNKSYRGWRAVSFERDLLDTLSSAGRRICPLREIADIRKANPDEPAANAIYIPPAGGEVTTDFADRAPEAIRRLIEVELDPAHARAPFLAAWFNEPIGRTARQAFSAGTTVPSLALRDAARIPSLCRPSRTKAPRSLRIKS